MIVGCCYCRRLYQLLSWMLDLSAVLMRPDLSNDAELLVLRHENAVLCRQVARVRAPGPSTGCGWPPCPDSCHVTVGPRHTIIMVARVASFTRARVWPTSGTREGPCSQRLGSK